MVNIISIWRSENLRYLLIAITLAYAIVPYTIFNYSYILLVSMLILLSYWQIFNKSGLFLVLLTYSLVIPYVETKSGISFYIPYIGTVFCVLANLIYNKSSLDYNFKFALWLVPILMALSLVFALQTNSYDELKIMILFIVSTLGIFFLSISDRLRLDEFYAILDWMFYLSAFFAILEFFFAFSPYQFLYNNLPIDFQVRTKGLIGHPLVFSAFLSIYSTALFSKLIIYKKVKTINFILLILMLVICASRTGLILIVISFALYIFLTKSYKKPSFILAFFSIIFSLTVIYTYLEEYLGLTAIDRVFNTTADQRLGSYPVAIDVFNKNIFGIGISKEALKYELTGPSSNYILNSSYDSSFLIFDNTFLTLLVSYGVFSILMIIVFIRPVVFIYRFCYRNTQLGIYFQSILLIFIVWFLENLSFDSIFYFPINSIYFILAALIIKEAKKAKQEMLHTV